MDKAGSLKEVSGKEVENMKVLEWYGKVRDNVTSFLKEVDRRSTMFVRNPILWAIGIGLDIVLGECGGVTYTAWCNSTMVMSSFYLLKDPIFRDVGCLVPKIEWSIPYEKELKKIHFTIGVLEIKTLKLESIYISAEGCGSIDIHKGGDRWQVSLSYYYPGASAATIYLNPAPTDTWKQYASKVAKEYRDYAKQFALIRNPEEFVMGLAEILLKFSESLKKNSKHLGRRASLFLLYP